MLISYAHFYSFENFIKFGILGATSFAVFMFYIEGSLCSAFLYLHLICYACYLKFKKINDEIKQLIQLLKKLRKSKFSVNLRAIKSIIIKHDKACSSLVKFNKFWRLVIYVIYIGYQAMFCMMLLQAIMLQTNNGLISLVIKVCMGFGAVCAIFIIQVFALSAEMVSTEVFSFYPKLVTLIRNTTGKLNVKERIKLQNMMIRVFTKKIGFTSYDLFVVDRRAVYQVCFG